MLWIIKILRTFPFWNKRGDFAPSLPFFCRFLSAHTFASWSSGAHPTGPSFECKNHSEQSENSRNPVRRKFLLFTTPTRNYTSGRAAEIFISIVKFKSTPSLCLPVSGRWKHFRIQFAVIKIDIGSSWEVENSHGNMKHSSRVNEFLKVSNCLESELCFSLIIVSATRGGWWQRRRRALIRAYACRRKRRAECSFGRAESVSIIAFVLIALIVSPNHLFFIFSFSTFSYRNSIVRAKCSTWCDDSTGKFPAN